MTARRSWVWPCCLVLAACGEDKGGSSSGGPVVLLVVDANRDGVADPNDPDDVAFRNEFNAEHGASFLANLDDDDGDGVRDADDTIINGPEDLADLARMVVAAWPDAPDGAAGRLDLDPSSLDSVRVWLRTGEPGDPSWELRAGAIDPCVDGGPCRVVDHVELSTDQVRRGAELGIEARRFRISLDPGAWSGQVDLGYQVTDAGGHVITSSAHPDGVDHAVMRVAPWVLNGNLSPFDRVWSADDSSAFVAGLSEAASAANIEYRRYSNWADQWTQDFFQTAWTAIPGKDGSLQGMRVANARPWGRAAGEANLPITWLRANYLGPDQGILEIYRQRGVGTSYDSHGNHDLIPPYSKGAASFPLGRIFHGSGVLPETTAFYDAQEVQGPHFQVDTSWLLVGHVDEVFSFVPAATPRGWKLLVASMRRMRRMLEEQQAAGNGGVELFVGRKRRVGDDLVDAAVSIDATLANADLMEWSQESQANVDDMLAALSNEVGLGADEIVEVPVLMEDVDGSGKLAWTPGSVNLLAFGDFAVPPKPFGPVIDGRDIFERDLEDRLGTPLNRLGTDGRGLKLFFADDWYSYHILDGEVHCGSNPDTAPPLSATRWWEVGR